MRKEDSNRTRTKKCNSQSAGRVIAAVGNGDGRDGASYQGNRRKLYQGRALVVVRTAKQEGSIHLTGMAAGLTEGVANIEAKKTDQRSELR